MGTLAALVLTGLLSFPVFASDRINVSPQDVNYLSLEFGEVSVGKYSDITVGLNAPKDKGLQVLELAIAGDMFTATTNCAGTIDPGKYCAIKIYFAPTNPADHYGELTIKTSEGNVLLQLYGTGIQ